MNAQAGRFMTRGRLGRDSLISSLLIFLTSLESPGGAMLLTLWRDFAFWRRE